ncbi:MAG TPA: hypothetical protein VEK73_10175 [Xanthobacteraceae bacterium]|nr:hypothetical protein [Xanthobacteraceae bacterium]
MSLRGLLARRSTFTALGNSFFAAGVILLFVLLFHEAMRAGPMPIIVGVLLLCAVASWIAAARVPTPEDGER